MISIYSGRNRSLLSYMAAGVALLSWMSNVAADTKMAAAPTSLKVTLVGGPTALIEFDGIRILTDPTFDPPGLYQEKPVRFEKTTGPSMTIEEIGPIDAVLLSHDEHFDNLDRSGRAMLPRAKTVFTTQSGAGRLGGNAIGMAPFETRVLVGRNGHRLYVTATPARHGPIGIKAGDVVGFVLGVDQPGDLLYATGDTVWYEGTEEVAHRFSPRVVMLFTGAAEPRGRYHMTMGSEDVLDAIHAFPYAKIVSVHSEGWVHLRETQGQLMETLDKFGVSSHFVPLERARPETFTW